MTSRTIETILPVPRLAGAQPLDLRIIPGRSITLVGPNGGGKTRLAVFLETRPGELKVHRIPAHKSLEIPQRVGLLDVEAATAELRFGGPYPGNFLNTRWGQRPAVHLLNDYGFVLQRLFAEHIDMSLRFAENTARPSEPPPTSFSRLQSHWENLLPHRALRVDGTTVKVRSTKVTNAGTEISQWYSASDMSDGERAILYYLGQALVAEPGTLLIVDEPEAHVNRAILGSLWDYLEDARRDCSFLYITHEPEFVASRRLNTTYLVRAYEHQDNPHGAWDIAELDAGDDLSEDVLIQLIGSRKPVLLVEGKSGGIDVIIYGHCYRDFTIRPMGGCDAVIDTVDSFRLTLPLHRLAVYGVIDADGRSEEQVVALGQRGVHVVPVMEVENLFLLPDVFLELAKALHCADPPGLHAALAPRIFAEASKDVERTATRHAKREIDRRFKRLAHAATDRTTLRASYRAAAESIDTDVIVEDFATRIRAAIDREDLPALLKLYDNKGLLALAARAFDLKDRQALIAKLEILLGTAEGEGVRRQLISVLPPIVVPQGDPQKP